MAYEQAVEIVKKTLKAVEEGEWDVLESTFDDNFLYHAWPLSKSKEDYIALLQSLTTGFPDWKYEYSVYGVFTQTLL